MGNEVRKSSAAVADMAERWDLIHALMGGTHEMRERGKAYLPQWPAEDVKAYQTRLATAVLFPALARTVAVLTGKPFAKAVTVGNDVPPAVAELLHDVDMQGTSLHVFASRLAEDALSYGIAGILVDCPPAEGARSVADERAAGIRPYFVAVRYNAILGWKAANVAGRMVLTQLRLLEHVETDDGEFGTRRIEQVRVLTPGAWQVYRRVESTTGDDWQVFEEGETSLAEVPFVPVYGLFHGFMRGRPPLMELAHLNVEHWQSASDQQTILHVARVPILFTKEIGDTEMTIGAGAYINASSPNADAKYVEHSGAAIEAGRLSLLDLEDRMRQVGAELLVIKPGNTTRAQTFADNDQQTSDLQRIMQGLEHSLDRALGFMAAFLRAEAAGHVTIFADYGVKSLAEASAELLLKLNGAGKLSHRTLLSEVQRRNIISPDVDVDAEIAAARAEAPKADTKETVTV